MRVMECMTYTTHFKSLWKGVFDYRVELFRLVDVFHRLSEWSLGWFGSGWADFGQGEDL